MKILIFETPHYKNYVNSENREVMSFSRTNPPTLLAEVDKWVYHSQLILKEKDLTARVTHFNKRIWNELYLEYVKLIEGE